MGRVTEAVTNLDGEIVETYDNGQQLAVLFIVFRAAKL
jgi:hypothetical protein